MQLPVHCQSFLLLAPLASGGEFLFAQCQEELAGMGGSEIRGWQSAVVV